jgi:HEAT repeats
MKFWIGGMALVLVLASWSPAEAGVRIGIGIGFPFPGYYYPPCYSPYYYGYYPPPVVVAPAPVIVAQPTVLQAAPPVQPAPIARPSYSPPAPLPSAPEPINVAPRALTPTAAQEASPDQLAAIDRNLQQLGNPDERVRAEASVALGRLRANQAVEPLKTVLTSDRSPMAREAAARGLGLIAAPSSLSALQTAAQADDDRDVRSSARFAAEVLRSHP